VAMTISSAGGLILDNAVAKFKGIAVFQPVFNGVGGNLVAVQASRISTYLHTHVSHCHLYDLFIYLDDVRMIVSMV
jgi:cation transporter-like permease